jgi:hypothetical protein
MAMRLVAARELPDCLFYCVHLDTERVRVVTPEVREPVVDGEGKAVTGRDGKPRTKLVSAAVTEPDPEYLLELRWGKEPPSGVPEEQYRADVLQEVKRRAEVRLAQLGGGTPLPGEGKVL